MLSINATKNLVIIVPLRKRSEALFLLTLIAICSFSCSKEEDLIGAAWEGNADFMYITENKMKMNYASHIPGNSVFIGSFYEVLQEGSNNLIDRIEVKQVEFEKRTDGTPYCRIWGSIETSNEMSYLLADGCRPLYQR